MEVYYSSLILFFCSAVAIAYVQRLNRSYKKQPSQIKFLYILAFVNFSIFFSGAAMFPYWINLFDDKFVALWAAVGSVFLFLGYIFLGLIFTTLGVVKISLKNAFFLFLIWFMFSMVLRLYYLPVPHLGDSGFLYLNFPLAIKINNYLFALTVGLVNSIAFFVYAKKMSSIKAKTRAILLGLTFLFAVFGGNSVFLADKVVWLFFSYSLLLLAFIFLTISFFYKEKEKDLL